MKKVTDRSTPSDKVDRWFDCAGKWRAALLELRKIVLDCPLVEELKWGQPCYTLEKKNVALIHGFNDYCALAFFKGVLMKDPEGILIQQTENVQSGRQLRFTGADQIVRMAPVIKRYILEAIETEKSGRKVEYRKTSEFPVPEELETAFRESPALKKAFEALTPGRQRGYLLHFAGAKQSATRKARIQKHAENIMAGKGLHD